MSAVLETCLARAHRTLKRPLLMIAVDPQHDGSYTLQFAHADLHRDHVAAMALDLMRSLAEDINASACSDCASCRARQHQLQIAIAALEATEAGPSQ
ncbi:hypothetical protein ABE453_02210 [Brevundimonas diminuta]|uniref:hypothetical protein n=1 Tax=Brevundimonas diminuta TaxID=293 RepID=UPI0032084E3C